MKIKILLALLVVTAVLSAAKKPVDLQKGEDRVEIPAISAGLCLHNLFQSNMVIQRDKPIKLWGWATAGEKVTVTLDGKQQTATAAKDRSWKVTFPKLLASAKPRKIIIKGKSKTITLDNILLGDIWILGGQSNMEHPIVRVEDGDLEIASANYNNIRVLTVPAQNGPKEKQTFSRLFEWHSFFRTHYRKGDWDVCTPETVRELSGIGYVFARRLYNASKIPIAVIDISRGGTCIETWLPINTLKATNTPEVKSKLTEWDKKIASYKPQKGKAGPTMDMNRPGNCYASMLAPIAGLPVKGAIWHQGYNNAMQAEGHVMYYQLFGKMIEAWRTAFEDPKMAFGIISLCTDGAPQTLDNYLEMMLNEGQYIRQMQYQTYLDYVKAGDKNVGFASSYDMRRSWYHPGLKVPVGERIARWALATQYGKKVAWQAPRIIKMETVEGKVILTFDVHVGAEKDSPIEGFAIAGKDRRFQPAKAEHLITKKDTRNRPVYDYKKIVLSSPYISEPIHYRYAWGRNPMGNLRLRYKFDSSILATQRSDNWKIYEVPFKFGEKADRRSFVMARNANRMFDMQRRLNEAQRLLDQQKVKNAKDVKTLESNYK
jgi:sialate O-acetylesterase